MHVSLFFLILIVCAEINNVHAILQQHRQKLSDKTSGMVMTCLKRKKRMDKADPKGGFQVTSRRLIVTNDVFGNYFLQRIRNISN